MPMGAVQMGAMPSAPGMVSGILDQLGPLGPKSSFFVQTVDENSDELADLLA